MPVSVLNRLPANCFLTGPTRRKSLGSIVPTELVPGYGVMAPSGGMDYPPYSLCLVRSLRLLMNHLAGKRFAVDANVEQDVTS